MESCCVSVRLSGDEPQARPMFIFSLFCEDVLQPFQKWPETCGLVNYIHRLLRLVHLTFRESPTPIRCWCHAEWTQHLTKNRGHNPTRDAHGATGILSCNMWVLFWTKKMGSHRMLLEMNIFVRSSKGQSRYPLITTVLLQKMIFSSYFEDGSWNTLPIGVGACEPRWRIGWFEGKVFVLRQICRQKSSLPSMLSYFSFYTTGIHSWKVWMSPTFPLKSGDSIPGIHEISVYGIR